MFRRSVHRFVRHWGSGTRKETSIWNASSSAYDSRNHSVVCRDGHSNTASVSGWASSSGWRHCATITVPKSQSVVHQGVAENVESVHVLSEIAADDIVINRSAYLKSRVGSAPQNPVRQQKVNPDAPPEPEKPDRRVNRAIVARNIRLITDNGHEVVSRMEALRRADAMDLDLVEVDGKQDPPVCKLMDFNKERFKDKQREKDMKKRQSDRRRLDDLKEVRFSTRTASNDLELKAQMAKRFLLKGHRVKLAVIPHGNDQVEPKGRELVQRMVTMLDEACKVETGPRIEKQRAWVLVRPTAIGDKNGLKRKKDALVKSYSSSGDEVQSLEYDQVDEAGNTTK